VSQTTEAVNDTVVTYSVGGTATEGTDYPALAGSVTIPGGSMSATINVTGIVADSLVEGTESVTITLTGITDSDPGISIGIATDSIDILDGDSATVSISGTIDGNEAGAVDGVFTVSQTTEAISDTVLTYTVAGSATSGVDYTALSGSVTIPGGSTSASITVPVITPDSLVEGAESVTITLTGITADPGITIGTASDSINILDNDTATVSIANSGDAAETSTVAGEFTLTMTTTSESATVVSYNVGGTATDGNVDYTSLSGTVTILAGATGATIDVTGINNDTIVEGNETVVVTLTGTNNGLIGIVATPATVNIADNDTATVSIANSGDAAETSTVAGEFTLTMTTSSESATVVSYTVTGTATDGGTDYTTLPVTVTIPAGDTIVEGNETVVVTLTGTNNGLIGIDATPATVNIADNDTATVSIANSGNANETGSVAGEFTLTMTTTSESPTVVSYNVGGSATAGGTDYATLSGTVTIPANSTTATIAVDSINNDSIVEGTETVVVTLTGTNNGLIGVNVTPATVNILDNETATVSIANNGDANETGTAAGQFTLTMTTSSESATMVSYNVGGTATDGTVDYASLSGTVTIPANSTTATIDVGGINDDSIVEDTETVIVTLTGTDDGLIDVDPTPATVNIADNDTATVDIVNNGDADEAGPTSGQFLLSMSTSSESATVVSYTVTGTATDGGTDYTTLPVTVTIPAGDTDIDRYQQRPDRHRCNTGDGQYRR
jgi:hypothetical protein